MTGSPVLQRRLGTFDATVIGLGSMVGAGVFVAFAPAAAAAGSWLLVGLGLALAVAFCNATSSAQLAAAYPSAGGTYVYGRERLGHWWGFAAGWSFVVGKTASCAAMCLAFAAYVVPEPAQRPVAAGAVALLVAVNVLGVQRTATATKVLLAISLAGLTTAVVAGLAAGSHSGIDADGVGSLSGGAGWYGVAQAGGLLFFAFAGYARIATLGEEVREPRTTIPRAILLALLGAALLYVVVGTVLVRTLGVETLANATAPVRDLVVVAGWRWAEPVVVVAAAAASLGALLALLAGIGRTSFAMSRAGDLPAPLTAVGRRSGAPWVAEVAVGVVVIVVVSVVDLRGAIGFSSFGVLLYYAVANLAALTQTGPDRRYPRVLQVLGLALCVGLVATLPPASILAGVVVLAVGLLLRRFGVLGPGVRAQG